MLLSFLYAVVKFVVTLPLRILFAWRLSAVFTLLGFFLGLLGGILGGYFFFIYPEPEDTKELEITNLGSDAKELTPEQRKRFYRLLPPWVHSPDVERVGWMNKLVAIMWPYIDEAVSAQIKEQAAAAIQANKPSFIDSIDLTAVTLGRIPPSVIGIKSFNTLEDEVIFQPLLRWVGRPNIKVVARVFGMSFTAHLSYLSLEAPVRITLKPLSNYFPCFSKIVVSLMAPPTVDVGLSILGLDFLVIPAVDMLVAMQVEKAVEDMLLWPIAMTIYDEDPLPVRGKLYIRDVEAHGLKNVAGLMSLIDPYARFGFGRKVGNFETERKKDDTEPNWKREDVIWVRGNVEDELPPLLVQVFHDKKPRPVLIGQAWIPLAPSEGDSGLQENVPRAFHNVDLRTPAPEEKDKAQTDALQETKSKGSEALAMTKSKGRDVITGTISFKLEFVPRLEMGGDDETGEEEEIVFPDEVPVGGGVLWVKLRSARELESKKTGYVYPRVFLKVKGQEKPSRKYKETDIELFDDLPFTWPFPDPSKKPDKESLHIRVVAEAKGASLSTVTNPLALKRMLHSQAEVGSVSIPLRDVVENGRTLEEYSLVGSKGSSIKVEIRWAQKGPPPSTATEPSAGVHA